MTAVTVLSAALIIVGAFFFTAGTAGLLRFPDVHSRVHALTKADNLGLGFIVLGLLVRAGSVTAALKLILIWLLALVASATSAYLIANYELTAAESEPVDDA